MSFAVPLNMLERRGKRADGFLCVSSGFGSTRASSVCRFRAVPLENRSSGASHSSGGSLAPFSCVPGRLPRLGERRTSEKSNYKCPRCQAHSPQPFLILLSRLPFPSCSWRFLFFFLNKRARPFPLPQQSRPTAVCFSFVPQETETVRLLIATQSCQLSSSGK